MRQLVGGGCALLAAVALCLLTTVTGGARGGSRHVDPRWSPLKYEGRDDAFRMGTAGRPFTWSTAIGDLNADGRPDYAVADRIGRATSGFAYSVRFAVSGIADRSVTFDSPEAALSITLRDVDHDQDLDVLVSTVLSPTVLRVWLNDGRGVFTETARRDVTTEWQSGPSAAGDEGTDVAAILDLRPRNRASDAHMSRAWAPADRAGSSAVTSQKTDSIASFAVRTSHPRAPPLPRRFLL